MNRAQSRARAERPGPVIGKGTGILPPRLRHQRHRRRGDRSLDLAEQIKQILVTDRILFRREFYAERSLNRPQKVRNGSIRLEIVGLPLPVREGELHNAGVDRRAEAEIRAKTGVKIQLRPAEIPRLVERGRTATEIEAAGDGRGQRPLDCRIRV